MTRQQQRDKDYLAGYDVGTSRTLTYAELTGYSIAFARGYRHAVEDRETSGASATLDVA